MDGAGKKCSGDSLLGRPDQRSEDKHRPPRYRAEQRRREHESRGGMEKYWLQLRAIYATILFTCSAFNSRKFRAEPTVGRRLDFGW